MSDNLISINTKLISSPKYNNGVVVAENMYDWTNITEESFITYQQQFCGNDATISFILTLGTNYCKGELLRVGHVVINIDMTPTITTISVLNLLFLELQSNNTYLIYIRWSDKLNILEICAIPYTFNENIPKYKLQPYHYMFNANKQKNSVAKYNIELKQLEYNDVIMYSFDGKITNIKIYNEYLNDVSELLQMFPTNQHLIINDVARKFVTLPGTLNR
jgi:hypothetical protein